MANDFGEQTQFEYLYNALVNKFPGLAPSGGNEIFQFSTVPYAAAWADGTPESTYASANLTSDTVTRFLTAGSNFDQSYATLINSLKVPNSQNNADYTQVMTQLNNVRALYKKEMSNARSAYENWKATSTASNGTTTLFETWLSSIEGREYGSALNTQWAQIQSLTKTQAAITKTLDAAMGRAQAALLIDQMTITPSPGDTIKVPRYSISGDLTQDKINWDGYAADKFDLDVTINAESTITHKWQVLYSQSVEQKCLTTHTRNSVNTSRIIQDKSYSLNLKAKGVEMYNIIRGKWYSPTYVNPNVDLESGVPGVTNESMFGLSGPLHLVPDSLVVIYKPTMSLTTTTETYEQYIKAHANADVNWMDIFGLRFDLGESSGIKIVSGPKTTTVEMPIPGDSTPQVFGVQSKVTFLAAS